VLQTAPSTKQKGNSQNGRKYLQFLSDIGHVTRNIQNSYNSTIKKKKQPNFKMSKGSWAWWCVPAIPALQRLRQEDHKFQASLNYTAIPCLKNKQTKGNAFNRHFSKEDIQIATKHRKDARHH
jgi:hypothetical protein